MDCAIGDHYTEGESRKLYLFLEWKWQNGWTQLSFFILLGLLTFSMKIADVEFEVMRN